MTRVLIESVSLICVNLFIFISGWFGITLRRYKIADLVFQITYFYFGIYIVALLSGYASIDIHSLKHLLLLTKHNWFIPAYILLCIIAPVLNIFADSADRTRFRMILIGFFVIQTWCGWLAESDTFNGGYSTISFIGVYLLARYIRKYDLAEYFSKRKAVALFIVCVVLNTSLGIGSIYTNKLGWLYLPYINPLTIMATVCFAIFFTKITFQSNIVNFIAKSAFAVFLLHSNFNLVGYFIDINQTIYNNYSGFIVLVMIFFVCCVWFVAAVLLDQPRKWLWTCIQTNKWTKSILKIQNVLLRTR